MLLQGLLHFPKPNGKQKFRSRDNCLYNCRGHVFIAVAGIWVGAKAAGLLRGSENAYGAFPTVKNHSLFRNHDPLDLLCASVANTDLKNDLDIKSYRYRIEASIEANGINRNVAPQDLCRFRSDGTAMLQKLISVSRQIHTNVFKAIPIPACIHNSICLNANGIPRGTRGTRKSVFRHSRYSPLY